MRFLKQLCILSCVITGIVNYSYSQPRILVLHSYHVADWTNGLQNGIQSGLKDFHSLELFVDYMDTKKCITPYYLGLLYKLYEIKYSRTVFDIIITTDNNALDFVMQYRTKLFNNSPVVFCGVNEFDSSMLKGEKNVTGVIEKADFSQTIDIAFKARPTCDTIFIICDKTSLTDKQEFLDVLTSKYHSVKIGLLQNLTYEDLGKRLQTINKSDFIFFIAFWQDLNGNTITPQNLEVIFKKSNAPIFGSSEWMIDRGMTGGMCVTAYSQGYAAAQQATRILNGESINKVRIIDSPNKYMFNYQMLKKYNISPTIIPKESIISNKPAAMNISFQILILLTIIVFLLILIIILFVIYNKMHNRSIENIKASEEKYREIIEKADLLVIKLNCEGLITFINQGSDKFLGLVPAKCIGRKLIDFIHVDDRKTTENKLTKWISEQPIVSTLENRVIHTSGSYHYFLWTITTLSSGKGACAGLNAIGRDISAYRKIQDQLQNANKLKAIGTLAGGIAHDFNNLLAGILGYAEVSLLDLQETDPTYTNVAEIRKISLRARELVRQILTFSRQTTFEPYPVQICEVIEEVLPLLRATIPSTIEIRTNIKKGELILADQTRIHQIIMNLCTNSFHAMEENGGILSINISPQYEPKNNENNIPENKYIVMSIEDNGIGIPEELQSHIFDPFFTTKQVNKGTGLGLSVVHGIVNELNGFIRFKSEQGKGSCFSIYFPIYVGENLKTIETLHTNNLCGSETIIIIDDEEIVASSLNAILVKHGYHTRIFTSSKLALEMIKSGKTKYDLIITDMTMPEFTGMDIIQQIDPKLPVILCTGYNDKINKDVIQNIPAKAFLTKPIKMNILLQTIREILDNKPT